MINKALRTIVTAGWVFQRYDRLCYWSDDTSARVQALTKFKDLCKRFQQTYEITPGIVVWTDYYPNFDKSVSGWEIGFSLYINKKNMGRILEFHIYEECVSLVMEDFTLIKRLGTELAVARETIFDELNNLDLDMDGIE